MSTSSQRFAVGQPGGARSMEWVVMWKTARSDVYIAARTLGGALKASVHESGQCHVRAPNSIRHGSPNASSHFLDVWSINPQAAYEFPFGIIIPEAQLRGGEWVQLRDKGTIWLPVAKNEGVEVAVFLIRSAADQSDALAAAGWHTIIVNTSLSDGRRLLVVAGKSMAHQTGQKDIDDYRAFAHRLIDTTTTPFRNPRGLLFATDKSGTRRFVEVAAQE